MSSPLQDYISKRNEFLESSGRKWRFFTDKMKHTDSPNGSSSNGMRQVHCLVDVIGVYSCSKTIRRVVRTLDDLFDRFELHDLLDRPEDLFLRDAHVVGYIWENRRLDKEAFVANTTTSTFQRGTVFLAWFNELKDLCKLLLVDLEQKT